MAACEKRGEKVWEKCGKSWRGVKKFVQKKCGVLKNGWLAEVWWEKCGKVCTRKLFDLLCKGVSFASFAHRSITTTNFRIE